MVMLKATNGWMEASLPRASRLPQGWHKAAAGGPPQGQTTITFTNTIVFRDGNSIVEHISNCGYSWLRRRHCRFALDLCSLSDFSGGGYYSMSEQSDRPTTIARLYRATFGGGLCRTRASAR